MFDTLYSQIGAIIVVAVLGFALMKGEEPERIASGVYLVAWLATLLIQSDTNLYTWQPAILALDCIFLAALVGLSWKSGRSWPVWASGFQLLAIMSLIIPWMDVRPPAWSYFAVANLGTYGVLACLAIGTFWVWQERRAAGLE